MTDFDKSRYKVKRLFPDEHFENGFHLLRVQNGKDGLIPIGKWQYPTSKDEPRWMLGQWYSGCCFATRRKDVGDPYILTDEEDTKKVVYNPEEKSLSMQLNAQNVYKGGTQVEKYWPHLLIEQRNIVDYKSMPEGDEKKFYSASSDRITAEFDIRVTEYIPSPVREGDQRCQFVAYAYLQLIDRNFIYVGYRPLVAGGGYQLHFFNREAGGKNFIYALSTADVFGGMENSFLDENMDVKVSDEWKHVEVDLTPHIDSIIKAANDENLFGRPVSRDEFYFSGTNVGFEIHNNISCTVEIKNYNLVSYIKKDEE